MNIGIFEPDADIGDILSTFIYDMGHRAYLAGNYHSAANLLCTQRLDVVVLSKHLTGDVQGLADDVKRRGIRLICISTGKINLAGCDTFIQEPFDIDVLEKAINC